MVTERQIVAILSLIGSIAAFGFAIYNLYENFKPNSTAKVARVEAKQ